mmetsp:Transcript_17103/g.42432  ORF Transcript_17103/g.42432 Transcript_17103/m.42432 type:complete len:244 (-) Transcript_17103:3868-4599(-)
MPACASNSICPTRWETHCRGGAAASWRMSFRGQTQCSPAQKQRTSRAAGESSKQIPTFFATLLLLFGCTRPAPASELPPGVRPASCFPLRACNRQSLRAPECSPAARPRSIFPARPCTPSEAPAAALRRPPPPSTATEPAARSRRCLPQTRGPGTGATSRTAPGKSPATPPAQPPSPKPASSGCPAAFAPCSPAKRPAALTPFRAVGAGSQRRRPASSARGLRASTPRRTRAATGTASSDAGL